MDRQILYPAQIPLVEDGLNAQRNAMVGVGHLASAAFGANTVAASGFACSPADGLAVTIAPGALLAPGVVDASAYGTLTAVSSALVRQFISRDPVSLTVPSAGAAYVVYVTPQTVDTDDTVLPFYNAADPSVTYAGQNNSGLAAPTVRRDEAVLAVGSSAPSGAYPLWQIVVPAGATTLTADMLSIASGAPFYPSLAAVASRIIAPFNAQLAVAIGGYPLNAVVAGTSPGTFWVSTADANVSVPGATDATWQSLFNGYATQSWVSAYFATQTALAAEAATRASADASLQSSITSLQSSKQNNLGFTPVQQGTGVNQSSNAVKIGWGTGVYSGRLAATVDITDIGTFAMTSDLPTAGTITGGTYTKTPLNDGTGQSVLRQKFTVTIPAGTGTSDHLISFPFSYSSVPSVGAISSRELNGNQYSTVPVLWSNTAGSSDFVSTSGVLLRINSLQGSSGAEPTPNSVVITVDVEGIVS
ncbi:MAG: hypothetical protein ABF530_10010 [Acetobacter orientalis]|uniref:hypothetical protein n=1 Tax=Acetobacter orientalis TaxID=146474 RepID=UPI0039E9DDA5